MIQRLESFLLIVITVLLVLIFQSQEKQNMDVLINEFESDIRNEEILKRYYVRENTYYLKAENRFGRLGLDLSESIENGVNLVVVLFDEIFTDILK